MKGIIDIHNHILHRVDDGSDSIEESIEMLKQECKQGVTDVIVTPHYHVGENMNLADKLLRRFKELTEKASESVPDITLHIGNEIMMCNDIVELLDKGQLFTLAGSQYVLVEFFPTTGYSTIVQSINNILNGGYTPIIAHCERYKALRKPFKVIDIERINHLVEMGAYLQVNASTVCGKDNKFVSKLIDNDFLHLIASDAHSTKSRRVLWEECVSYLEKKYSEEYIRWLLIDNPRRILEGKYI